METLVGMFVTVSMIAAVVLMVVFLVSSMALLVLDFEPQDQAEIVDLAVVPDQRASEPEARRFRRVVHHLGHPHRHDHDLDRSAA